MSSCIIMTCVQVCGWVRGCVCVFAHTWKRTYISKILAMCVCRTFDVRTCLGSQRTKKQKMCVGECGVWVSVCMCICAYVDTKQVSKVLAMSVCKAYVFACTCV